MTELNEEVSPTTEPVETIPADVWPPDWKDKFEKPPIFTVKLKNCLPEAVVDMSEDPETAAAAEAKGMGGQRLPAILFSHSQQIKLVENTANTDDWVLYPVKSWPGTVKAIYIHKNTVAWITKHQKWYGNVAMCWRHQPHPEAHGVYMATELYMCSGNSANYMTVMKESCANCDRLANRSCRKCPEVKFCSERCATISSINGVHPPSVCRRTLYLELKQHAANVRTLLIEEKTPAAPAVTET